MAKSRRLTNGATQAPLFSHFLMTEKIKRRTLFQDMWKLCEMKISAPVNKIYWNIPHDYFPAIMAEL